MDNNYREAFAEVLEIIKHSKKGIIDKIPLKFIDFLKNNKSADYIVNIDFNDRDWMNNIKIETKTILGLIYRDYIVSPQEREKLINYEIELEKQLKDEKKKTYDADNLFKKHEKISTTNIENSITVYNKNTNNYIKKLFNKIMNFIKFS